MNIVLALVASIWCTAYSQTITNIAVTQSRGVFKGVAPGQTDYFINTPCPESAAGNNWAVLSIAQPTNVEWNSQLPYVAVEISRCQYTFDANCVFATNYVFGSSYFPTISWQWATQLDTSGSFYIRITAPIASVEYSFHMSFVSDASPTAGQWNTKVFRQSSVPPNAVFNQLIQSIATEEVDIVHNGKINQYFVAFCAANFPPNCDPYSLVASLVADVSLPYSGFNLYACTYETGYCNTENYDAGDLSATGNAQVIISSDHFNATQGIFFGAYGFGGQADGRNGYTFDVKLYC